MTPNEVIEKALSFKHGGMSAGELSWLYDFCKGKKVIELGSMVGQSSYVIASVCDRITCVDAWDDSFGHLSHSPAQLEVYKNDWVNHLPDISMMDAFILHCASFIESGKLAFVQGKTEEVKNHFSSNTADILLIDADHEYEGVKKDIDNYLHTVKQSGIVLFHDYGKDGYWTGVTEAADEAVEAGKIKPLFCFERIGVFQKIN